MAVIRARSLFPVRWRSTTPTPGSERSAEAVAPLPAPFAAETPAPPGTPAAVIVPSAAVAAPEPSVRERRIGPPRGPDGRFLRRGSAVANEATTQAATPAAAVAAPAVTLEAPVPVPAPLPAPEPRTAQAAVAPAPVIDHGPPVLAPDPDEAHPFRPPPAAPIRIVLVEDVPEVVSHLRELLRSQPQHQVVGVVTDGRQALAQARDLEPDVVLVDALLQGRTGAAAVVEGLRSAGSSVGIVVLTVPQQPVEGAMARHADAVLTLPVGTFDLGRGIRDAHAARVGRDPTTVSRVVAVFSAKGGVGKTTIAFNLAACLASQGQRTLLLDGSLQLGDVRRLLRADPTAPSICDLPTDSIRASDLADTVLRGPSGLDVLLAPPRPELADLISARDIERLMDILRRTYQVIVIDTASTLGEPTFGLLDAADLVLTVVTPDGPTLDGTRMVVTTLEEIGYSPDRLRFVVNRFDTAGALPEAEVARAIGRRPEHAVASDWRTVSACNAQGRPFVIDGPDSPASVDLRRVAEGVRTLAPVPVAGVRRATWRHGA